MHSATGEVRKATTLSVSWASVAGISPPAVEGACHVHDRMEPGTFSKALIQTHGRPARRSEVRLISDRHPHRGNAPRAKADLATSSSVDHPQVRPQAAFSRPEESRIRRTVSGIFVRISARRLARVSRHGVIMADPPIAWRPLGAARAAIVGLCRSGCQSDTVRADCQGTVSNSPPRVRTSRAHLSADDRGPPAAGTSSTSSACASGSASGRLHSTPRHGAAARHRPTPARRQRSTARPRMRAGLFAADRHPLTGGHLVDIEQQVQSFSPLKASLIRETAVGCSATVSFEVLLVASRPNCSMSSRWAASEPGPRG